MSGYKMQNFHVCFTPEKMAAEKNGGDFHEFCAISDVSKALPEACAYTSTSLVDIYLQLFLKHIHPTTSLHSPVTRNDVVKFPFTSNNVVAFIQRRRRIHPSHPMTSSHSLFAHNVVVTSTPNDIATSTPNNFCTHFFRR